jgi:hypothetical protein
MGISGFMDWEFDSFTYMIMNGEQYPWPQSEIDAALASVMAAARNRAQTLAASGTQETELATIESVWVPEVKGFLGFGSKPGYSREEEAPTRPGGWRVLRRPAYHQWASCQFESPRPSWNEMRCDEAWLRPDGSLEVGMINYTRYGACQWTQGSVPLSNDHFMESLHFPHPTQLLSFDVSFDGGIIGRDRDYGRQEEFRPHTGMIRFSQRPFEKLIDALKSAPDHGPVPETPW